MEMHGIHLVKLRVLLVKIETLRLTDVRSTSDRQIHHTFLLNLPHCLVNVADVLRDLGDILHTAIVRNDLVLDR